MYFLKLQTDYKVDVICKRGERRKIPGAKWQKQQFDDGSSTNVAHSILGTKVKRNNDCVDT